MIPIKENAKSPQGNILLPETFFFANIELNELENHDGLTIFERIIIFTIIYGWKGEFFQNLVLGPAKTKL